MTESVAPSQENSLPMFRAMVGIGLVCALIIALTYEITLPIIDQNKAEALEAGVFRVLPGAVSQRTFRLTPDHRFEPYSGSGAGERLIYAGYDAQGRFVGVAIEARGQGFADVIRFLYGYSPERQVVIGFLVLESKETPGLGDKIAHEAHFLANFEGLDASLNAAGDGLLQTVVAVKQGQKKHPWEIDGITGATISSKAIGNAIQQSIGVMVPLVYRNRHQFENTHERTN